jgi:soluble lytic murein transglycosylase-like protein
VNRHQVIDDRRSGMSLTQVAKKHGISRASVCRIVKQSSAFTPANVSSAEQISWQAQLLANP